MNIGIFLFLGIGGLIFIFNIVVYINFNNIILIQEFVKYKKRQSIFK